METMQEVIFKVIDMMKMVRNVYPVNHADAKMLVLKFCAIHEFTEGAITANSLPLLFSFIGLFTRGIMVIRNGEIVWAIPSPPSNDDFCRAMFAGVETTIITT